MQTIGKILGYFFVIIGILMAFLFKSPIALIPLGIGAGMFVLANLKYLKHFDPTQDTESLFGIRTISIDKLKKRVDSMSNHESQKKSD